jgi:CHAT domain-containing protein/Tfp pilus assembly protein PilF
LLASLLLSSSPTAAAAQGAAVTLQPGLVVEKDLRGGESHLYHLDLDGGSRWLVDVEQRGIDIVVELTGQHGDSVRVDAPTYRQGSEWLLLPAASAGSFRVGVRSKSDAVGPGGYELLLRELPAASVEERRRLTAVAAVSEADRNYAEATAASRRLAVAAYRRALVEFRALGDSRWHAVVLFRLGVLYGELGEPDQEIDSFLLALPQLQKHGERAFEAMARSNLGLAYWKLGENEAAQAHLKVSLALHRDLGNRYGEAIARNNQCLRSQSLGELREALACYEEVLSLLREQGELRYEALILSNLGGVYDNLGEPRLALDHHQRALALRRATGDRTGEARSLNNAAVVYRGLSEMREALIHYGQALDILHEVEDRRQEAITLNNVGYAYASLGEPQRALSLLLEALRLRREVGDRRGESITLTTLARVRADLGEDAAAAGLYRQALDLRREVGDRRGEAAILTQLGRHLVASGDPSAALGLFDQALEIAADIGDRREEANARHARGEARLAAGRPGDAATSLEAALVLRRAVEDHPGEIETLHLLALAERRLGKRDVARRHLEAALERIETLRMRLAGPELKASFLATQRRAYELYVDLLMEIHAEDDGNGFARQALAASERARARSLVDLLAEAEADVRRVADPRLRERREELLQRLSAKATRRLALRNHGEAGREAQLELDTVLTELDHVEAEIRRRDPRYDDLVRPRPLDAQGIQALLDDGTMLLEYALGEERSFLWAVTSTSVETFELPDRARVEAAARDVHRQLSTLDLRAAAQERQAAQALSRMLLGPVAGRLDGQRLVIVPDGALHYLPFAILPRPGNPDDGGEPLIEDHEVVHLPSASALAWQRRSFAGRSPAPGWVAVVADPVFDRQDPRLAGALPSAAPAASAEVSRIAESPRRRGGLTGYERLPATGREAAAIAELAPPGETLTALGLDANRDFVLGEVLSRYRVVHFATHGVIDAGRPELSGLVLSLVDDQGRDRDGFVRLRDVYNLELAADLVVLSGCETALGREVRGEGLIGLTRGFMYAGAPRVVASLWRVQERATTELMARFYRALRDDELSAAAALRRAQLSIRRERRWSDPYYWGGFLLQGDWK